MTPRGFREVWADFRHELRLAATLPAKAIAALRSLTAILIYSVAFVAGLIRPPRGFGRNIGQDLQFAFRHMRRRKASSAAAILTLALGLGATTAVFTVLQAVLLQPLPYASSHRLVNVWNTFPHWRSQPALADQWDHLALDYPDYRRVADRASSFDSVAAAWYRTTLTQDVQGNTEEIPFARGSVSLLPMLGVQPVLGRWFLPGEEGPGAPKVAVLPYALWTSRFGSHPDVLGRSIMLGGDSYEIIGVLPASFRFGSVSTFRKPGDWNAVWTTIGSGNSDLIENSQNWETLARLRPGVTMAQALEEVRPLLVNGRDPAKRGARIEGRLEAETGASREPLVALFAAALLLLVVTCANLAALLLGDTARRLVEIRTRLAIGAGLGRIVRQLLTESVALALTGAALAVPVSIGLVRGLLAFSPEHLPRESSIATGWPALAFCAGAAIVTGMIFGLAPARLLRSIGATSGSDRAVTTTRARTQQWMIGAEAALSMILLVSAMLLVRSLVRESRVPPGFATTNLLAISVAAPAGPDRKADNATPFYADLQQRLAAVPGVDWVTATSNPPLGGADGQWAVSPDPAVKLSTSSPNAQHDAVWTGYFAAMGIPLLDGRTFEITDTRDRPRVAIVNQTMARRLWPGSSPIDKQFLAPNGGVRTVIGVVANTKHRGLGVEPRSTFYESVQQLPTSRMTLLVHAQGDAAALGPVVRAAVLAVNRAALIERVTTMDALVAASMKVQRFRMLLLQFFAVAALIVTVTGLGGVAVHAAAVRMRELSVRMAVGATPAMIRRLVLSQYAGAVAIGTAAGAVGAAAILRIAASQVFGVTWHDPISYLVAAALIVAGSWLVGWRSLARLERTNLSDESAAR